MPARKAKTTRPTPRKSRTSVPPSAILGATRFLALLAASGVAGAFRVVSRRPVFYGGTAAFLTLTTMVGANALRQDPAAITPLIATREMGAATRPAQPTAMPAAAPVAAEPVPEWRPVNDPRIMSVPLVREVQQLLAAEGLYDGEIDGRPGQATDIAIRSFQEAQGLRVDGVATPLLLTQIRQYNKINPTPGGDDRSLEERVAELNNGGADRELVRHIQAALTKARVAELKPDGIAGEQTRAAIRTFQALHGMDVTGDPEAAVLEKLTALGAVN